MIIFKNPGVIDVRGITIMGINAKDISRHTIGRFGTGIKYAIAILLRTGHEVVIMAGTTMLSFTLKKEEFRGKAFDLIHMTTEFPDGTRHEERLAFTTEYGKHWKMWEAYRELYCNSVVDEGGSVYESGDAPDADPNATFVVVMGAEFAEEHRKRSEFILDPKLVPRFVIPDVVEVYNGRSSAVFNNGIKVGDVPHGPSRYTYNVLKRMYLSEDRRMVFESEFMAAVGHAIQESTDEEYLRDVLMLVDDSGHERDGTEFHVDFSTETPRQGLFALIKDILQNTKARVSNSLHSAYRNYENENLLSRPVTISENEKRDLDYELARCKRAGFHFDGEVRVVAELGSGIMSKTVSGVILLAAEAFKDEQVLMEELGKRISEIHLGFKFGDDNYTTKLLEHVLYFQPADAVKEHAPEEAAPRPEPVWVLKGVWSGYTAKQRHIVHYQIVDDPDKYQGLHTIEYTDGTTLALTLEEVTDPEAEKLGYTDLIEECLRENKGFVRVADLPSTIVHEPAVVQNPFNPNEEIIEPPATIAPPPLPDDMEDQVWANQVAEDRARDPVPTLNNDDGMPL